MSATHYRGQVLPAARPPGENVKRCGWGPCEAGGWILDKGPREEDEHGGTYHPGCLAKLRRR